MKLYYSLGACALAPQVALREAGLKFDLVKTDLRAKTYEGGDFKKINPKGYVPALQLDDGEVLTENAVLLQWIADQVPDKKLFPKLGTKERYHAMEWLNFISTELHKGLGVFFNPAITEDVKKALVEKLQLRLEYLNKHLEKNPYILGNEFSVADAYAYNVLGWTKPLKVDISKHTAILGFLEKIGSRPTVKAAHEAERAGKTH